MRKADWICAVLLISGRPMTRVEILGLVHVLEGVEGEFKPNPSRLLVRGVHLTRGNGWEPGAIHEIYADHLTDGVMRKVYEP